MTQNKTPQHLREAANNFFEREQYALSVSVYSCCTASFEAGARYGIELAAKLIRNKPPGQYERGLMVKEILALLIECLNKKEMLTPPDETL